MKPQPQIVAANDEPKKQRRHRKKGPGLSRKQFSDESDIPLKDVNAMITAKKLAVVQIGSLERIPYSELKRILAELGPPDAASN